MGRRTWGGKELLPVCLLRKWNGGWGERGIGREMLGSCLCLCGFLCCVCELSAWQKYCPFMGVSMPQWALLGASCGEWGAAGFVGLRQFHNPLKSWCGPGGQGRALSSAQPASSMPHKPCILLFLVLMNHSLGTGSWTPEGHVFAGVRVQSHHLMGKKTCPASWLPRGSHPLGGLQGPGHQEGLGVGIRVGDHLEGPAAAKRCLCCREGLGRTQLKAPIPKEAGCVELCLCVEGRRLSRRNRERCTSVEGTRAGRAGTPQEQAWLPFWLSPGQALDMPYLAPQQS